VSSQNAYIGIKLLYTRPEARQPKSITVFSMHVHSLNCHVASFCGLATSETIRLAAFVLYRPLDHLRSNIACPQCTCC